MDSTTRAHVTGKVDMDTVCFAELRLVAQSFCNLISSTNNSGRGGGAIAMNIGSIASVPGMSAGPVISDGAVNCCSEKCDQSTPAIWSLDEAGWPVDDEGWPIDGQLVQQADGQLNFVKGNGKGKCKGCFNCGEGGRYARECPKPPKGKSKGKGKADDRICYNCGKSGHISKG